MKKLPRWLNYSNVMVTLLAFVVLAGGAAVAKKKKSSSKATKADFSVTVTGSNALSNLNGSVPALHTVQVTNNGPGKARPVVFVGAGGIIRSSGAMNMDSSSLVQVPAVLTSAPGCTTTGPSFDVTSGSGQAISSGAHGALICLGPQLKKGASATFPINYRVSGCSGDGTLTTTAAVISALNDPNPGNDSAAKSDPITSTGCA